MTEKSNPAFSALTTWDTLASSARRPPCPGLRRLPRPPPSDDPPAAVDTAGTPRSLPVAVVRSTVGRVPSHVSSR